MPDKPAPIFLDTAYVYALVNTRDEWHPQALQWQARLAAARQPLVTTQLILVEIADGLASIRFRRQAVEIISALQSNAFVEILSMSADLLSEGLDLYRERNDKDWGMTDCVSFVAMRERRISDALTADEHFSQAGFRALLRESI